MEKMRSMVLLLFLFCCNLSQSGLFKGVHGEPGLGSPFGQTSPLLAYRFEVALPLSRKCGSFRISPAFSKSLTARLTVLREMERSEAMVLSPGQALFSLSMRS